MTLLKGSRESSPDFLQEGGYHQYMIMPRHSHTPPAHILVVDDDARLRSLLQRFLKGEEYTVSIASTADEARSQMTYMAFDLLLVDVMMPGDDGYTFIRQLRTHLDTPVLMLTARSELDDRLTGLRAGADDYLCKPFDPRELLLRIQAILRRQRTGRDDMTLQSPIKTLRMGTYCFNIERQELSQNGAHIHLTPSEADLLVTLAHHVGEPLTRSYLVESIGLDGGERTVDVQMARLRRKIESDPRYPRYLQTVRGTGYQLKAD